MKTNNKTPKAHATKTTKAAATTPATTTTPKAPAAAPAVVFIPTEAQVAEWVSTLEGVRTMLGDSAAPMTAQQRRHALRAKKGGEPTVGLMAGLGTQYNVQLPGIDPQQIQQNSLLAQRLQPLETKLRVISGLVSDTVANAKTESWQGTTALYTALTRASKRNPALQKELAPAVEFFKKARASTGSPKASTKKAKTGGTTGTASAASAAPADPTTTAAASEGGAATTATAAAEPVAPAIAATTATVSTPAKS